MNEFPYLKELQKVEADILSVFIKICEDNALNYFIDYGTLLGAVRHGGFIPWDDDIDVCMPREDYNRFCKLAETELPEGFFLQTREKEPMFSYPYATLRNSKTTYTAPCLLELPINHGAYIDILILDGCPANRLHSKIHFAGLGLLNRIINFINPYFYYNKESNKKWKTCLKKLFCLLLRKGRKRHNLDKILNDRFLKYSFYSSRVCMDYVVSDDKKYEFSQKDYIPCRKIQFENLKVNIPCQTEKILKALYGDYMNLPAEKDRRPEHNRTIIALDTPFEEFLWNQKH